jgi:pimeloyl-ACP methyl ester carboxylesterase
VKMKKLCPLMVSLLLLGVLAAVLLAGCGGTQPTTTTTTVARVGDTGVDWPNQLFKFYKGLGKGEVDIEAFKVTASAQKTVEYQSNFYLFKNEMDPAVLGYWEALGMKKELHDADNLDLKWASYTPVKALAAGNTAKYPVVFDFVGGERLIFSAEAHGFAYVGATKGFITICPANPVSNGTDTITPGGQVVRILDALEAGGYPIDRSRVYVVGMSAGGVATAMTGLEIPNVVAGVAMHSSLAVLNTVADESGQARFATSADNYAKAMEYGMPMLALAGDHDMAMLPIKSTSTLEGLNLWLKADGCPTLDPAAALAAAATSTDEAAKNLGFVGGKMWTKTIDGVVHYGAEFDRADGTKMVELICVTNSPHWPSGQFPELAWDFLSRFSRDAQGNLVVAK